MRETAAVLRMRIGNAGTQTVELAPGASSTFLRKE